MMLHLLLKFMVLWLVVLLLVLLLLLLLLLLLRRREHQLLLSGLPVYLELHGGRPCAGDRKRILLRRRGSRRARRAVPDFKNHTNRHPHSNIKLSNQSTILTS